MRRAGRFRQKARPVRGGSAAGENAHRREKAAAIARRAKTRTCRPPTRENDQDGGAAAARRPRSRSVASTIGASRAKKNAGVLRFKRFQAAIGRPIFFAFRRPREKSWIEPGFFQPLAKTTQAFGGESDVLFLMRSGQSDAKDLWLLAAGKINHLPGSGQFGREVSDFFGGIDEDGEEFFVEAARQGIFFQAPARGRASSPKSGK